MRLSLSIAVIVLLFAEPMMTLIHRWVFHGPLWCWHRSHHEFPGARRLVKNDLLWLTYFANAGVLLICGISFFGHTIGKILAGVGTGAGLYGMAYIFIHDGVAHSRFYVPRYIRLHSLFRKLAQKHHFHHRGGVLGPGAAPFGVYCAQIELYYHINSDFVPRYRPCSTDQKAGT